MFCMQCGAKLPDNAKFCFQCGAKVLIDTSAHEETASVEPKSVQETGQNEQASKAQKTPMAPKENLIQPEEKVVLKLGNRNLEFSEEIKDKIAMTSYYNDIGKANGEKFRKFYQNAQIAVMEDVMKKVYPFYDNLVEQTNRIAFQRLLSRKIYDIRESDYYGKIQHTSLKGKEPLKFYSEYRRDYLQGGRTGKEKLANPVNTMMCFEEALKDHAYILKMIEARILVEHGLLKEYNFDTVKIDTRRENIKSVFDSVCNREHTDQEIQKAYEDVLNADIEGIQANPFKALYYAEIYSIGKILKNYEGTNAQLLQDLFKAIDFFEVRESCEDAINQIARNQLKKKLEELHQSPDKAPMLYQQMLQIANEVKEDNPLFDLADFNDELNQCAMAWLNLKLDEVHKSPDQILTLYPQLIQILNKIKADMPFFNAADFMEYAESFEMPSSEKIYFVLAANLLGHFKKNMRGLAIGTEGIYLRDVWKIGFISWDEFCDEDIYIQDGVRIGDYVVVFPAMEDILCQFLLNLRELSRIPVGEGSELVRQIQQEENGQKRKVGQETEKAIHKVAEQSMTQKNSPKTEQISNEKTLEEKYCPVCKKANKKNAKFCLGCGFAFNEERICPKCGNKIRPGKKFCSACGAKVEN